MATLNLHIAAMTCRHCVREVTAWLRDVPGVQTVSADARTGLVELSGTMSVSEVLATFEGSSYAPRLVAGPESGPA